MILCILPNLSKMYERCMYIQIYEYLNKILSKWQCGFRQGYSAQHYSTTLCKCCKVTYQTENKEQKLMMRIVSIVKFCSEFHKALY